MADLDILKFWPEIALNEDRTSEEDPDYSIDVEVPERSLLMPVRLYSHENEPADFEFYEEESDEEEFVDYEYELTDDDEEDMDTDPDETFCSLKSLCTTQLRMASTENATVSKEHIDKRINCCVCLEDFYETEKAKCLPCGHFYHEKCILQWFRRNGACPLCRKSVADF